METTPTFFFYDLETSGLDPKTDRIMQFAGIRTDLDFNPIGEPVNVLVKLSDDTLPSPAAINVTGITPQSTQLDGLTEPEFCHFVQTEIFTEGTIAVGYNSIRFDDEHMRYTFYRNFYDPYEWQWKNGRSRWDLLDVVRMVRALRPEGIEWPVTEVSPALNSTDSNTSVDEVLARSKSRDSYLEKRYKPNNRLENLTKVNHIIHEHAHDALSDVEALISVTKLLAEKQPKLYDYLFNMRNKKTLMQNFNSKRPFVYTSGRYPSRYMHTTVVAPIGILKNGNLLVYDLRYNLEDLLKNPETTWFPIVKELAFNKCPAVAPLGVLDAASEMDSTDLANPVKRGSIGWAKIGLEKSLIEKHQAILNAHLPEFAAKMQKLFEEKKTTYEKVSDVDGQLYEGFIPDGDRQKIRDVPRRRENELADYHPIFEDPRLSELLLHYKGRNFQKSLSETEQEEWEKYRLARLRAQEKTFIAELERLKDEMNPSILEDLLLWYQSLASYLYR